MKKYQKITKERFDRIKTLTNIGIKNTEVCRALNVSNPVVINVKKSEDFEAYKARNLARKLKYTKPVTITATSGSVRVDSVTNENLQRSIEDMQATLDQCVTLLQTLTSVIDPEVMQKRKPWRF